MENIIGRVIYASRSSADHGSVKNRYNPNFLVVDCLHKQTPDIHCLLECLPKLSLFLWIFIPQATIPMDFKSHHSVYVGNCSEEAMWQDSPVLAVELDVNELSQNSKS
jgi:hypothetical protein